VFGDGLSGCVGVVWRMISCRWLWWVTCGLCSGFGFCGCGYFVVVDMGLVGWC